MGKDKIKHFVCCMVAAILVAVFFGIISHSYISVLTAFVASVCLAVGKEVGDYYNPNSKWDWLDLAAGALGALIGSQIGWFF